MNKLVVFLGLALIVAGCGEDDNEPLAPKPLTDIAITTLQTALVAGGSLTLVATPVPASAMDYVPVWSVSEGAEFVTVSQTGEVIAMASGLAAVKVKSGNIEKSIVITVLGARGIKNLSTKGGGSITIEWDAADAANGALYSEVAYIGLDGTEKTVQTPASAQFTNIADYQSNLKHRMAYLPESEQLVTNYQEETGYFFFEKTGWKILSYSSALADLPATKAINGDTTGDFSDRWHTDATEEEDGTPSVTIDLGAEATIVRFAVWPSYEPQKLPNNVRFEVSKDNITWTNLGEYTCDTTADVMGARYFDVTPTSARYFRWTGWEIYWMAVAEFDVFCK